MDANTTSPAIPQRKRRRPALACEQCRRRKVKCDRTSPCDQCVRTKSDACTYVPDHRISQHSHSHSTIMMRRGGLTQSVGSQSASPTRGSESPTYTEMMSTINAFDPHANQLPTPALSTGYGEMPTKERGLDLAFGFDQSLTDRVKSLEQRVTDAASSRSNE